MSKRKWDDAADPLDPTANNAVKAPPQASTNSLKLGAGGAELDDPEFVKDIDINDLRNRYMLTRASSQTQILTDTGATVTTKGVWYPDRTLATDRDPPLYLHVTATTKEALDAGVAAVRKLMEAEMGPLNDRVQREERRNRKWPEEKVFIGVETIRNFNVRAKVVGPGGLFVKHIQQETGARVQIRGHNSGFIETETGREHDEPMHICLIGPEQSQLDRARELAEDLLVVVREEWGKAKAVLDQSQFGGGYNNYNMYQQPQQPQFPGQPQAPAPSGPAPPAPPGSAPAPPPSSTAPGGQDAYAAYWAQIQSNPEYAAYYQQIVSYYQQQGLQVPGMAAPPAGGGPPPPPPANAPPPMPEQRREGRGQFGAVPPPPGL